MSSRLVVPGSGVLAALAIVLVLASGGPLRAQTPQEREAALVQRLDSLTPLYRRASEEAAAARAAREARAKARSHPRTDTILVGPLHVVTLPGQVGLAREMFEEALKQYEPEFRGSAALSRALFTFQWATVPLEEIFVVGDPHRVEAPLYRTRARMQADIRRAIGEVLTSDDADTRLAKEWYRGPVIPTATPAEVFREIAANASKSNRSCFDGDVTACMRALGLALDGDPFSNWYTPGERRQLVLRFEPFNHDRRESRVIDECRQTTAACDEFLSGLAQRAQAGYLAPLSARARASLLWFALERGGEGAWARLLAHPQASPEEALASASGLGAEQLVAAWRAWVLDHRPEHEADLTAGVLSAALWVLLFVGLAMRSTRWRLG